MEGKKRTNEKTKINNKENDNKADSKVKNKKKKHKKIKIILVILLICAMALGSWFGYRVYTNGGGEFNLKGVLATIVGHNEKTLENLPKIYCLVTGQSQNLTDTIMLCSYDPKTQEASILSIPRDTFIGKSKTTASSYDKINALYQTSSQKTLDAVNSLTGLNVQYYLNIDTKALRQIVDSIGGVYFDVPIDMDYDDSNQNLHIHLSAGYQLLDGDKAEQVVRFRHNNDGTSYPTEYGDNDLGRMKTQRDFVEAVIKKLATPSTLTKIPELLKIAEENVTTNLDISKGKDYAPYAVEFNTENLKTGTLPGEPEYINGISFYIQNKTETNKLVEELFDIDEKTTSQNSNQIKNESSSTNSISNNTTTSKVQNNNSQIKIEILNGTSDSSKLNDLKTKLKQEGYNVTKTGITTNTSKTTIINRTGKSNTILDDIKKSLNNIGIISSGKDNSGVDITIVIGSDYK